MTPPVAIAGALDSLAGKSPEALRDERRRKFLMLGTAGVA